MLSEVQLATVRAALRYWREEICPGGAAAAESYFTEPVERHLSAGEVEALEQRFQGWAVRYIAYDRHSERIATLRFFTDPRVPQRFADKGYAIGTVLIE